MQRIAVFLYDFYHSSILGEITLISYPFSDSESNQSSPNSLWLDKNPNFYLFLKIFNKKKGFLKQDLKIHIKWG